MDSVIVVPYAGNAMHRDGVLVRFPSGRIYRVISESVGGFGVESYANSGADLMDFHSQIEANPLRGEELKTEWVKELRSGKYPQCTKFIAKTATGALCEATDPTAVSFCCLGVLQKVAGGGALQHLIEGMGGTYFYAGSDRGQLVKMNDVKGLNFSQIADWIESSFGKTPNAE